MTDDSSDGDSASSQAAEPAYLCDNCGSLLDLSTWTLTTTDEDAIRRFCDEACRDAWQSDR